MPCAGLISYWRPTFHVVSLVALAALHLTAASLLLATARGAAALSCSTFARVLVVLCVAAVRGLETYIGSCAFRLVVRRLEGAPQLQQRASLVFGQAVMYVQLACGVLAFALVQSGSISCTL